MSRYDVIRAMGWKIRTGVWHNGIYPYLDAEGMLKEPPTVDDYLAYITPKVSNWRIDPYINGVHMTIWVSDVTIKVERAPTLLELLEKVVVALDNVVVGE